MAEYREFYTSILQENFSRDFFSGEQRGGEGRRVPRWPGFNII